MEQPEKCSLSAIEITGDLVETAFMMQGLLTAQQYFSNGDREKNLCDTIQKIWKDVEWTWFQQNEQQKLYWHWSPNHEWAINMPITGWNESLIVYILAASSPTYPIKNQFTTTVGLGMAIFETEKCFTMFQLPLRRRSRRPSFLCSLLISGT